jgi:hypothetical protein
MKDSLKTFEAISLISLIAITQIILGFPEYILNTTSSGSITNLIFLGLIIFIICFILKKIFKEFPNSDIIDISEFVGGNILKFIISIFLIFYLILSIVITISNYSYLLKSIYFSELHYIIILAFLIIPMTIVTLKGIYPIKKIACIFFPVFSFTIVILLFSFQKDTLTTNNFTPILGYNIKQTFGTGMQNIFIFNFLIMYYFIMPKLQKKNSYGKIVILSFLINLSLLIISILAILEFIPTSVTEELISLNSLNLIYLITKSISLNNFISQTDALFIFTWTFAILIYISFASYGITYILNKLFSYSDSSQSAYPISTLIFGICICVDELFIIKILENYVFKIYSILLIIILLFTISIIGYIKNKIIQKKKRLKTSTNGL